MLLVSEPDLGAEEKAALCEVIDSNWITMGARVQAFEQAFAALHQMPEAVAVNSCTAGLHLLLHALGIGEGDEVLVPSLSFVATANCVHYTGATPVFVDIESLDLPIISLCDAKAKCTTKTRAIIIVHYAGYIADRVSWRTFADQHGLFLIEDSAHAVGPGRTGLFGDGAVFSFYGNKNMTTGEGGMVVAKDPDVTARVRSARGHGLTSSTMQRLLARVPTYDVTMLGFNYRMTELNAAIGLVQLQKLAGWNDQREELAHDYRERLTKYCPDLTIPFGADIVSSHHILPVLLPKYADRANVMARLHDSGVQTTIHYPPIHLLSWYQERLPALSLPLTEEFADRELTLPLHPKMSTSDVDHVSRSLEHIVQRTNVYQP
jgi:dTDP-4-amino-4,6-dideoxygalactose transaminase